MFHAPSRWLADVTPSASALPLQFENIRFLVAFRWSANDAAVCGARARLGVRPLLDRSEANVSQILERRIIELGLASWIVRIAGRDDDDHALAGAGE